MQQHRTAVSSKSRSGFTLVELMVVVAILGVLAALALPALTGYLRTAKTSEATTNLNNVFKTAAAFYVKEQSAQGLTGLVNTNCIVTSAAPSPSPPSHKKQPFSATTGFKELGFSIGDFVYYSYGLTSVATGTIQCGFTGGTTSLYTFYAHGDLDGDTFLSTYSLACGSDKDNMLYHGRGIYVESPIE